MRVPPNCSKSIAATANCCACAFPREERCPANTNLFFQARTPSASKNEGHPERTAGGRSVETEVKSFSRCRHFRSHSSAIRTPLFYVLTRLKDPGFAPAGSLGRPVPPASLHADVCTQLLGRTGRSSGPPVEPGQLSHSDFEARLRRSSPAYLAHCRIGDALLSPPRLPPGVLPLFSFRRAQRIALPAGHRALVGELPGPRLCVENHSWQRRSPQRFPSISASHSPARRVPALQPLRRRPHAHAHLHAFRFSAHLRRSRTHPAPARGGLRGPRRRLRTNFSSSHPSALRSRFSRRRHFRLRPLARGFPRAAPGRRRFRHDDLQRRAEPVRRSLRLASWCGNFRLHPAHHHFSALPHRKAGKKVVLPMSGKRA